jgi:hypothetical protein
MIPVKLFLHSLILLISGITQASVVDIYERDAVPLPLPPAYQEPAAGSSMSRFSRKPAPPYWDAATRQLVVECCHPPICRGGVSHFYTRVYRLSPDGKTLTCTQRMWQSHKPQEEAHCRTYSCTSDSPCSFSNGGTTVVFKVDTQGTITQVSLHGKLFGDLLPEEGEIFFPGDKAPSLIQLVP